MRKKDNYGPRLMAFLAQDFSHDDFPSNIVKLRDVAGYRVEDAKLKKAILWHESRPETPEFIVAAGPNKFVGCQLIEVLLDGLDERIVWAELHEQVLAFFSPLFDENGHPLVDFVRKGEFKIQEPERF